MSSLPDVNQCKHPELETYFRIAQRDVHRHTHMAILHPERGELAQVQRCNPHRVVTDPEQRMDERPDLSRPPVRGVRPARCEPHRRDIRRPLRVRCLAIQQPWTEHGEHLLPE